MADGPKRYESTEDGDFDLFRNLPVFDEHEGEDGVYYDRRLLEAIAGNNNERIEDTGDWTPVIVGHTPDPDQYQAQQPEIIGFAGPYRVSAIGNKKPRHAIVADFRIFKDKVDTWRANPRRSVELWPEDRPEDRFFDPIAVLGAETPRRALGLAFSRRDSKGRAPYRYEMGSVTPSAPGGSNTYIPDGDYRQDKQKNAMDTSGLQGEDVAQLAEALKPLIQQIAADTINGILENQIEPDEAQEAEQTMATDPTAEPMADPTQTAPVAAAPDQPQVDAPSAFSKYAMEKLQKYACGEDDEHDRLDYAYKFMNALDDDEKGQAMPLLGGPDDADEPTKAFYAKLRYMCGGGEDDKEPEKMDKQHQQLAEKFRKSEAEKKQLAEKLAKAESALKQSQAQEKYAKRQRRLDELEADGFVIDNEADGNVRKFAHGLSDQQFDEFVALVPQQFQKVPRGSLAQYAEAVERTPEDTKADKLASEAAAIVQRYRKNGKSIEYSTVMRNMLRNGKFVPEQEALA